MTRAVEDKFRALQEETRGPRPWVNMGRACHTVVVGLRGCVDTDSLAGHFLRKGGSLLDLGGTAEMYSFAQHTCTCGYQEI